VTEPEELVHLWFRSVLDRGRDGTIYDGVLGAAGKHVVIKVYCDWDPVQAAAYKREVQAYQALAWLQGDWVPRVSRVHAWVLWPGLSASR
jgi:hypothetical protein